MNLLATLNVLLTISIHAMTMVGRSHHVRWLTLCIPLYMSGRMP